MTRRAFVTLHDVAPGVLESCTEILDALRKRGIREVTLLVVPGAGWAEPDLAVLRGFRDDGYPLAGHGWSHRAPERRTLYHRLHGLILSRNEAEHLSRPGAELRALVSRCHAWFEEQGLGTPDFYVPPAWALGALSRRDLDALPFRYYESLTGVYDSERARFRALPVVGYLADTRFRAAALRVTNALNRGLARLTGRPLRISIHPPDLDLHLADDLLALAAEPWQLVDAATALPAASAGERSGRREAIES